MYFSDKRNNMAKVIHKHCEGCYSVHCRAPDRGMVLLEWKKKTYSHGGSSWKSRKKIWRFSSLFSTVDRWSFSNVPSMSEHLKSCPFYQREELREPVALACLEEVREKHGELKHIR
ncbi:PREDICTED: F-box only protein 40 isoform X3 [Cyprinodon variegatus]|uniref:F-box only protein 40 isoform X3 n=1 Tax=Cyprinodon variegatus TaxID=28743 RepID=UPI0007426DE1|nr:PREDICTED: F-box only protein 40 isoform X3 [Cyprinodon variegatus]